MMYPMALVVVMMEVACNQFSVLETIVLTVVIVASYVLLVTRRRVWISMLSDALLKTKPWKLLINLFDHLSGPKSDVHRIPLLDLSKCHGLDRNSSKCHAKQELFIGGFLKHRWISHNYKRDTTSLLQGWNAFVNNVSKIGRQPWMDKVNA